MILKQEELVLFDGTISSGGLIHILCSSEYLGQLDGECEAPACIHTSEGTHHPAQQCVSLMCFLRFCCWETFH